MSKYTEGPWTVEVENLRGGRYYSVIRPGDTEPIDIHEEDNGEADARLIAAAPDMLEALRTISDLEFAGSCCGCSTDDAFDEAQKVAREALTKAGGQS